MIIVRAGKNVEIVSNGNALSLSYLYEFSAGPEMNKMPGRVVSKVSENLIAVNQYIVD